MLVQLSSDMWRKPFWELSYPGPGAWRTSGDRWCYEYRLKREGITVSPRIYEITYPNNLRNTAVLIIGT